MLLASRSLIELQMIPYFHGVGHLHREGRERGKRGGRDLVRIFRVPEGSDRSGAGDGVPEVQLAEDATAVNAEAFARRQAAFADDADEAGGVVDVVCRCSYYQLLPGK